MTFPFARWYTIKTIMALVAYRKWNLYQFDEKNAFVHIELVEDFFGDQPLGYQEYGNV